MNDTVYSFQGELAQRTVGNSHYRVVWLPSEIQRQLPLDQHPRLRIRAEVNDVRIDAAWQPCKGRWYLMLSRPLCQLCGVELGDPVLIDFWIADQDAVEVPDELRHAMTANDHAARLWDGITVGKRRSLCHYVASAKRTETRERRVEEVLEILDELSGD
ncbi:MAG: YdeI/OmpD-associated family protein [Rubripirellula sp.]